jgi:hypothetical protein
MPYHKSVMLTLRHRIFLESWTAPYALEERIVMYELAGLIGKRITCPCWKAGHTTQMDPSISDPWPSSKPCPILSSRLSSRPTQANHQAPSPSSQLKQPTAGTLVPPPSRQRWASIQQSARLKIHHLFPSRCKRLLILAISFKVPSTTILTYLYLVWA